MRPRTRTAALLLFGSGFCALVYQIGWLREFRLIFGASTAASAAVLAIFIGGLGIGSLLLGPRADAQARPLRFYSNLEATIAVCAAISPPLLAVVRALYIASGGSATLGTFVATLGRLVLSALVLALPTIAMGGTLPAVARAVTRAGDARRRDVAVLYAVNTLGAVAGAALATFWMLELFGTHRTLWLAAAANLLIAVAARSLDREWAARPALPDSTDLRDLPDPPAPRDLPDAPAAAPFVIAASATVGFAFFLLELIWYRLLAPLLGGTAFTFGLVLAIALAGVGIGGLAYALTSEDRPATLAGFSTSCLVEAAAVALGYALGDRLATLALVLLPLRAAGFTEPSPAGRLSSVSWCCRRQSWPAISFRCLSHSSDEDRIGSAGMLVSRTPRTPSAPSRARSRAALASSRGFPLPSPGSSSRSFLCCSAWRQSPSRRRAA